MQSPVTTGHTFSAVQDVVLLLNGPLFHNRWLQSTAGKLHFDMLSFLVLMCCSLQPELSSEPCRSINARGSANGEWITEG
jgi:hypothetical protein